MKNKRWRWVALVGLLAVGVLVCVFYFLSDAKRRQWVGVPEYQPFGTYNPKHPEPASPGTGPKAVEPAVTDTRSAFHGETTVSMTFAASSSLEAEKRRQPHIHPHPTPQVSNPSCDPAELEAIGQTLLATFRPIYDPLLTPISCSLEKVDALAKILRGTQNPIPEVKLPDPNARALASKARKTVLEWIVASQYQQSTDALARSINNSPDAQLQNLITQAQTPQSAPLWSNASAAGVSSTAQALAPQQLGLSSSLPPGGTSALGSTNALSGATGMARDTLRSVRPLGR